MPSGKKRFGKPSGVAGQLNREQKAAKKDFDKRLEEFLKEFTPLSVKYKIGLGAVLDRRPNATVAVSMWMDEKPAYEEKAKREQEEQEEAIVEKQPQGLIT